MPYESIVGSYFGNPILYSNYKKPNLIRLSFNSINSSSAVLVSTGSAYKFFSIPVEYVDSASGQKMPEDLNSLMGTVVTSFQLLTDFLGAEVTTSTYKNYLEVETKTKNMSYGPETYLEITAKQRVTPAGGTNPPQAWLLFNRPLVNSLPQPNIPVLYYEAELEIPESIKSTLVFPSLGNDNWYNIHEIKTGHGQNLSVLPSVVYHGDAGDLRLNIGLRRDTQTGLACWILQWDDGANNSNFVLEGVTTPLSGIPVRVLREVFTPGANYFLGKTIILSVYLKSPENNADRVSGITYVTATDKETGYTQVIGKFIGGELTGLFNLPYSRILFGVYSGGNVPYSAKIYNLAFSDKYAFDEAVFSEKFKYDDAMCYIPLKNSLDLQRGYGMGTFTRTTVATVFDNTGKLISIPAGVPRFEGARYVQNLLASTDTLATQSVTVNADTYTIHFTGAGTITFSGAYAGVDLVGTSAISRVSRTFAATAGTLTITVSGAVNTAQLEVGANASEYVSNGSSTLGANYHGLGIDGIKAFPTNINSTYIPSNILKGLLINHQSRTNNLLWSRDLTNVVWNTSNITVTKNQFGIDEYENSCSLLTATSPNAIISQTIITASVAASSSAYVKRFAGTGRIFFTRDGGSNWTEITSSINSSTFTRIKIENTSVLNPQVGFKIETSGDSIIVDYVQNEAGVEASMPIYTTSGAATRNAEVLNYPALHNFNTYYNAAKYGLICATFESLNWTTASGSLVGSSTAGLFVSSSNSGVQAKDGTNTVNGPTGTPTGSKKLGVRFDVGTLEAVSDNSWSSVGVYDGDFGQGGESLTWLAICTGGSGYVKDVAIWNTPITNQQVYDITYQQPYVIPGIASRHKRINPIPGVGHETPGVLASSQAQSVLRQSFTEGGSLLSAAALPARIDTGYPIVTFIGSTTFTVDSVDHIITLPTVSAGDGIIIVLTTDNDTSVTRPGEWDTLYNSSIAGSLRGGAYAIVADGTESGTTVNFVTSSAEKGAAQVFKITNWNGTLAGIQYGVTATSTSGSTADLPAINAYWGSSKMVCIGILHTSTSQTVSSAPAGYTNLTTASSGTSTSDGQCITAVKSIEGATEDPGVFTMSGTGAAKIYNTLAICPAYAGMYYERFNITRSGTTLWAGLYSSQPYQTPDTNITRAIIVVHGKSLDAAEYGNVVNKNMANYLGKAIVIAPFFERNVERADVDQLFWGSSWPEGGRSSTLLPWRISSAEVMDLLIANLYSTFPNLEGVILCGHSAGGQYCNRYSALSNDTRNRYLVSAASSYLYPGAERPDGLGNWKIPESPSTYDDYKYGLQNLSGVTYANAIGAEEMRKRLRAAKVTYMVGALDNDPTSSSLDITANAMVQGLHRVSRQQNYHEYLQYWDLSQY